MRTSGAPRLHHLAGLGVELEDLARRLRLHLDRGVGLDRPGGLSRNDDVAPLHRDGPIDDLGHVLLAGGGARMVSAPSS